MGPRSPWRELPRKTREELIETLTITLVEALEFEAEEAAHQIEDEYEVVKIAV